jgi:phage terminase Nu1 subunit (DNA packaging protein)
MHADFELTPDGRVKSSNYGGRREGAGRKPPGYVKPQEVVDYDRERARNEKAKADLNELDFKVKSGEYVPRESVQQAAATLLSTLAQTLRSLPDKIERKLNASAEITELIEQEIDACLEDLSKDLQMLAGEPDDV